MSEAVATGTGDARRAGLPLARLLVVMGGVYTIQSTVGAMMFQGVPTVLRSSGAALDLIGLVSLFMLPWALKFLWSPQLESWRIPATGPRRSRGIVVGGQLTIAAILLGLALYGIEDGFVWIFAAFGLIALIASTVDIAGDGFMIEQIRLEHRGWGNVIQVGGGYAGIMIGTGLFLVLNDHFGWMTAVLTMTFVAVMLTTPFLFTPDPGKGGSEAARPRPSLMNAFRRPEIRWGLLAMLIAQMGLRLTQVMTGPFLIDNGMSAATIGILTGTIGTVLCIACIVLTGLAIRRWNARRTLLVMLGIQTACFTMFAISAFVPQPELVLSALYLVKSTVVAGTFVALYTVVMDWTSQHQAGTDFTIFQCTDALVSVVAGFGSGIIAEHLGFGICFNLAAGFAVAALLFLPAIFKRADLYTTNAD
ncbi:MFS transporter [Nisaea acidiphila]|uniref:MFS transporter n=1 Tax=Nisaea acidiphila TaxID=1862145 RepID=A0A9J7ARR5_9PROT|nr:MFS transporter [Nisaea acidiphila]UUX49943.1 MFS transporter [Nisaea acidiphila]